MGAWADAKAQTEAKQAAKRQEGGTLQQKVSGMRLEWLTPSARRWEYAFLQFHQTTNPGEALEQVNLLGSYGWEMTGVGDVELGFLRATQKGNYLILWFKRER